MQFQRLEILDLLTDAEDWLGDKPPEINDLIYAALTRVADEFLEHVVKHRRRHFKSCEYTIYTNYLDSHLWFEDADLNRWFEAWRSY